MTIKLTDLRYTDEAHTCVDMVVHAGSRPPFPFHYVPHDDAPMAGVIEVLLADGSYDIKEYPKPPPPPPPAEPIEPGTSNVIAD